MKWIIIKLKLLLFKVTEPKKLLDRQRMVAYKNAYLIENFKDILNAQILIQEKYIALKADDPKDIYFRRGIIYQNQNLLNRMKKAHQAWVLERESELERQSKNK